MHSEGQMDYVEAILDKTVCIRCESEALIAKILLLEGVFKDGQSSFTVPYSSEPGLAALLEKLNNFGFPFVNTGPGWHPGDVYLCLRDKGLVNGEIKTISWSGPDRPVYGSA